MAAFSGASSMANPRGPPVALSLMPAARSASANPFLPPL
jgi:hypothetical protein